MPREPESDPARIAANTLAKLTTKEKRARGLLPLDFFGMLLDQIGGPAAFARQVADLLNHVSTPPLIRQRIITDMLHLMKHIEQKSERPPDLSDTPTEELEAMLLELLEKSDAKKAAATQATREQPSGDSPGPERGTGPGVAPAAPSGAAGGE